MEKIKSFCVNHNKLKKGMYLSRVDGDAVTYDIRMAVPNSGHYLENDGIHSFEHLFATYVRNSQYADSVIYAGPMGCRTGFYFIVRDRVPHEEAITLVRDACRFIADYEGEIPGVSAIECGNYLEHDLQKAKAYGEDMCQMLENWTETQLQYEV